MNTITDGIDRSFEDSMSALGRNVVYIEKWPWGIGGGEYKWWEYRNRPEMKLDYVEDIQSRSQYADHVAAGASRNRPVRYDDNFVESAEVVGATPNYLQSTALELDQGRFFTQDEDVRGTKVVVLGAEVVNSLFDGASPLGKEVRIQGQKFNVIGTFKKRGDFLGLNNVDNMASMPIGAYKNLFGLRSGLQLSIRFPNEATLQEGQFEVEGIMRQIRQLDPLEENDFAINKPELFETEFQNMTSTIYLVGIFLTFVSVKERTKEIGIRKAVGAKSWEILSQFLIEAIVLCLIGGVIGIVLSVGATQLINQFFVAYMSWTTVVNAVLLCSAVGIIFGFIPSYKAAKADPIESLRYE
jgi:putative ABC transport system permease protein